MAAIVAGDLLEQPAHLVDALPLVLRVAAARHAVVRLHHVNRLAQLLDLSLELHVRGLQHTGAGVRGE